VYTSYRIFKASGSNSVRKVYLYTTDKGRQEQEGGNVEVSCDMNHSTLVHIITRVRTHTQ